VEVGGKEAEAANLVDDVPVAGVVAKMVVSLGGH
jgi:hypothetical protein